jgi:hypothetical protein
MLSRERARRSFPLGRPHTRPEEIIHQNLSVLPIQDQGRVRDEFARRHFLHHEVNTVGNMLPIIESLPDEKRQAVVHEILADVEDGSHG